MSLFYKIIDTRNKKTIAITNNLYGKMEELLDDECVEDFINEIGGHPSIPHLNGYKAGTILRFLVDTGENDFLNAWESARQDFLNTSYRVVEEGLDWDKYAFYEYYRIIPIIEES